jgi:hypothetical protein
MDVRLQSCQMELMQFARGGDRVGSRWVVLVMGDGCPHSAVALNDATQMQRNATQGAD